MRAAVLVALVLLASASAFAARRDTKDLVNDLKDKQLRVAAYQELMKRKDPKAVYPILGLLPELDATGQVYGVNILAATGTKTADDSLRTLTEHGDPHLRVTAGAALYRKGDRKVVLSLADCVLTPDLRPGTRILLMTRLWGVPEIPVQSAVASLLAPEKDALLLYYALYFLHYQKADRFAPQATRLFEDPRPEIRGLTGAFLLRFDREEHVGPLAEAIREGKLDRTWWTRVNLYLTVAKRLPDELLDAVAARLPDEADRTVTLGMIYVLGREAYRPGARALRRRIGDGDRTVAGAAFDALLKIPGGLTVERLSDLLADPEPAIRLKAVDALRRHDDRSGLGVALEILGKGSPVDRVEAARVVGLFRRSEVVEPLLDALADENAAVRGAALSGLDATLSLLFPYRRFNLPLTGYRPAANPKQNAAAIRKIRDWWRENRTEDW